MAIELIKISELDESANMDSDSVFPIVYQGKTYKIMLSNVKKVLEYFNSAQYNKTTGQLILGISNGKTATLNTSLNLAITSIEIIDNGIKLTTSGGESSIIEVPYAKTNEIPTKTSQLTNDSGYVKNTDYATSSTGGVVKTNGDLGTFMSNGVIEASNYTYDTYQNKGINAFIGKGTLENALTGKGLIKSTSISSSSTDDNVVTPKAVYDYISSLNGNEIVF